MWSRHAAALHNPLLPAVTDLTVYGMHVGDASASALAAALVLGALPRLKRSSPCGIPKAGADPVWLPPRMPSATRGWWPSRRPCGGGPRWRCSVSWAARSATRASPDRRPVVAPPPPAGAPPLAAAGLKKLTALDLAYTQVSDVGCAALATALNSGTLPALKKMVSACRESLRAPRRGEGRRVRGTELCARRRPPCGRHTWRH